MLEKGEGREEVKVEEEREGVGRTSAVLAAVLPETDPPDHPLKVLQKRHHQSKCQIISILGWDKRKVDKNNRR
jgi:hypothetical protein